MSTEQLPYITTLEIEQVRCFGERVRFDFTAPDGAPAMWNVLLGENGTGKTTALQSIVFTLIFQTKQNIIDHLSYVNSNFGLKYNVNFFAENITGGQLDCLLAYGALRRVSSMRLDENKQEKTHGFETLFDESAGLQDPSEWLVRADYVAKTSGEARDKERLERVREALARVLPDVERADRIKIGVFDGAPGVRFVTPYGEVASSGLSSGYRAMAAWVVDLAARMVARYPDSDDPLGEPAVVLVDEFDLHLHPSWQRRAIGHLRACFPRVQFIVTAHSPLIVQELPESSTVHVLRREGAQVTVTRHDNAVRLWRVDQLLMSDLFDLDGARSSEVTAKLERRAALRQKTRLSEEEREELAQLNSLAHALPTEQTPEAMRDAELIRKTAALLRERGVQPDLTPPESLLAKLRGDKA